MSITELKNNFHGLIDKPEDSEILTYFYNAFSYSLSNSWKLSEKEKKVMEAYDESEDENNLINYETVKEKHLKWLSK